MSPRIQRLATDWKTYLALFSALGSAFAFVTDFFKSLRENVHALQDLPAEARWLATGLLAALAFVSLVAALRRRSVLLRPDRFVISPDDPRHLIGREVEIKALARDCAENQLVFLEGESGAGKTALVRAGLVSYCHNEDQKDASRLVPVLIDASSLLWKGGLKLEMTRAMKGLTPSACASLGVSRPLQSDDVFSWLMEMPRHAASRLLLVLDQIDDYFVAHREHFVHAHKVVTPEELERKNEDWAAIAQLLRNGHLHVLVVCRNDIAGSLDALRFVRGATFLLPRIDKHLISPLLEQVTQNDGRGEVIGDPCDGWVQLKSRLLRDLSADGIQILPVQFTVALDSLRRFRFLTLAEYARYGGALGLERLHIERHLRDAAKASGVNEAALLRGLMRLVSEDGSKTRRIARQEFYRTIHDGAMSDRLREPVIEHLERWRILRCQPGEDGEYLLLHHDYLARGVREVYRQANRWVEMLREGSREFVEALNWSQRWRALLPLSAQSRLLWARLHGCFRYGEHRRLALWSLVRLLPIIAIIAASVGSFRWLNRVRQEQSAQRIIAGISSASDVSSDEAKEWWMLAAAAEDARINAVRIALSKPSIATKATARAALLAHVVVGLDPSGQLSLRLAHEVIIPALDMAGDQPNILIAGGEVASNLRLGSVVIAKIAAALVARMRIEQDVDALGGLAGSLRSLSSKLEPKDAQPLAVALVGRMETEQFSPAIALLGFAVGGLSSKLEPKEVDLAVRTVVERMRTEHNTRALWSLGGALSWMVTLMQPRDAQTAATALLKRMNTEQTSYGLGLLGEALASLITKLEPKDVQPGTAILINRMKTEQEVDALLQFGKALDSLSGKLESKDAQPLATALVERINREQNYRALWELRRSLGGLTSKLNPKDVQSLATALVERIKTERNSYVLSGLGAVLGSLSNKLDPKEVQIAATALVQHMTTPDQENDALSWLGKALAGLSNKLQQKDVHAAAKTLVERMQLELDSQVLSWLGTAVAGLSSKLDSKDVQPAAIALVQAMKAEKNSDTLSRLGEALAGLSSKLEPKDAQPLTIAVADRMKTAHGNLQGLATAWVALEDATSHGKDIRRRLQLYVHLLQLPLMVGKAREALIGGLEKLTGERFGDDLWGFMDWATTTDKGKTLRLDFPNRPSQ